MAHHELPLWGNVEEIECGINDDCEFSISRNNKRFQVLLARCSSPVTIEGSLVKRFNAAIESRNDLEIDIVQEEIADLIYEACQPIFRELAPTTGGGHEEIDLHSLLNPETFQLQLVTVNGTPKIVNREGTQWPTTPRHGCGVNILKQRFPRHSSSEIRVLRQVVGASILKVMVDGQERCCKIADQMTREAVKREYISLKLVADAGLASSIRVPKLLGLISSDSESNELIGILEEYICSSSEASTLRQFNIETVSRSRREKWAAQIQQTIYMLHGAGVAWGDGKPDNIMVDLNDDIWIIDFGGGWTEGWVDKELAGTIEGDKQALKKIIQFLQVD